MRVSLEIANVEAAMDFIEKVSAKEQSLTHHFIKQFASTCCRELTDEEIGLRAYELGM